jgi:hypothetical protein
VRWSISPAARHSGREWIAVATSSAGRAKRRVDQVMWAWASARIGWGAVCGRRRSAVSLRPNRRRRVRKALHAWACASGRAAASGAPPRPNAPALGHRGHPSSPSGLWLWQNAARGRDAPPPRAGWPRLGPRSPAPPLHPWLPARPGEAAPSAGARPGRRCLAHHR